MASPEWAPGSNGVEVITKTATVAAPDAGVRAVAEAQQLAHIEMVSEVLETMLATRDFLLVDAVVASASDYVYTTRIVRLEQREEHVLVEVEARLREDLIRRDAALLVLERTPNPPTVLLLVAEQAPGPETPRIGEAGHAGRYLRDKLQQARLRLVEPAPLVERHGAAGLIEKLATDPANAGRFAREMLADAAVAGTVALTIEDEPLTAGNLTAVRARLVLEVHRADAAGPVHVIEREAVVRGLSIENTSRMAIEDTCEKAYAEAAVYAVIAASTAKKEGGLLLTVEQPGTEGALDAVLTRLTEHPGVTQAEILHFSPELGRIQFKFDGNVPRLIDALTESSYPGFRLAVHVAVGSELTLRAER